MDQLSEYAQRISPGLCIAAALLALLPRERSGARLMVHLGVFVVLRDAMTPVGLWQIEAAPVVWLRLPRDPGVLGLLALGTCVILLGTLRLERTSACSVIWLRGRWSVAIGAGVLGAIAIATPGTLLALDTPVAERGGAVAAPDLAPLLVFALIGNAYEELLFRGFLQGSLSQVLGDARAAWFSALAFAFGHVPLAIVVTDVGAPILIFTAFEGLICAQLYRKLGLVPAVIAHGGGIFLLASGLI